MTEGKLNSVFIFLEFFPILSKLQIYNGDVEFLCRSWPLSLCIRKPRGHFPLCDKTVQFQLWCPYLCSIFFFVCDSILINDTHLVFCFLNFYRWVEFKHGFLIYCETELITVVFVGHVHMLLLYKCDITILYLFAFTYYMYLFFLILLNKEVVLGV